MCVFLFSLGQAAMSKGGSFCPSKGLLCKANEHLRGAAWHLSMFHGWHHSAHVFAIVSTFSVAFFKRRQKGSDVLSGEAFLLTVGAFFAYS